MVSAEAKPERQVETSVESKEGESNEVKKLGSVQAGAGCRDAWR